MEVDKTYSCENKNGIFTIVKKTPRQQLVAQNWGQHMYSKLMQ